MKKNANNKNITLLLLSLLMLTGCAHKNIVKNVSTTRLLLKDAKNGKERVYDCSNSSAMSNVLIWLSDGDIVSLKSNAYAFDTVFTPQNAHLSCDYIELQRRKKEFEDAKLRYEIQVNYPKKKSK